VVDVALKLLGSDKLNKKDDSLPADVVSGTLRPLAQMPSVFLSGCQFGLLERIIYSKFLHFSYPMPFLVNNHSINKTYIL